MPTIERLKRRADFLAAAGGRRFHTERMTAQGRLREPGDVRDAASGAGLRLGFTITKRVGHATERNRIRRRLRSAAAEAGAAFPHVPADVVVIARRPALHAPFGTLVDDLRRAAGLVTKPRAPKPGGSGSEPRGASPTGRAGSSGAETPDRPGSSRSKTAKTRTSESGASGPAAAAGSAKPDEALRGRPASPPPNAGDGPTDGQ